MALSGVSVSILTVSDRCSRGDAFDSSGLALKSLVEEASGIIVETLCVADDFSLIKDTLNSWTGKVNAIVTTGGTGLGPRDVTPEATEAVIQRHCAPLALAVIGYGTPAAPPTACLSRAIAGTCNGTLIVNLPGSERAVRDCWTRLLPVLKHASNVLRNDLPAIKVVHERKSKVKEGLEAQRARESEWKMVSVSEAQEAIRAALPAPERVMVPLEVSVGRVVAEQVTSSVPLPPFRASVMDGYAVSLPPSNPPLHWQVIAAAPAGSSPIEKLLTIGTCIRVSTGGPIPPGDNISVVPVEDTGLINTDPDGNEKVIEIKREKLNQIKPGQFIREIGSDMKKGELLVSVGDVVDSNRIAVLASANVSSVPVFRFPVVGVLSTGDELATVGTKTADRPLIYDSNRPAIISLLKEHKFPCIDLGICPDRPDKLFNHLARAESCCDVIITSGGVSMGEKDYLKRILVSDFSATIHFGRVNLKPGKPTTFASWKGNKYLFGLPGNPVSTMVTTYLFVLPALRAIGGYREPDFPIIPVQITEDIHLDPRSEYKRIIITQNLLVEKLELPKAHITGIQASSRIISMEEANGLLILPQRTENQVLLQKNTTCKALLLGQIKFIS